MSRKGSGPAKSGFFVDVRFDGSSRNAIIAFSLFGVAFFAIVILLPALGSDHFLREVLTRSIGLVVVAILVYILWKAARSRTLALKRFAKIHGLRYSATDPFNLKKLPIPRFRKDDPFIANLLYGEWEDLWMVEFDYTFKRKISSEDPQNLSCVLVKLPVVFPALSIGREDRLSRLGASIGKRDVQFELAEFNDVFKIESRDSKFAHALIDARMMKWLLGLPETCSFQTGGVSILCATEHLPIEGLEEIFRLAKDFVDHIPRAARSLYGTGSSAPA